MALDYRSFSTNGEAKKPPGAINKRWWLIRGKADRAQSIASVVKLLQNTDSKRQAQYNVSMRLYGNSFQFGAPGLMNMAPAVAPKTDRLTYNVVQAAVDTVTAKIAKNKPKPMFLTSGGDWKLQRRAKKLDKFVEGIFYENNAYRLGVQAFKDSCVPGDGLLQVYEHENRVRYERVLAGDLFTDPLECMYGDPRQLHRIKTMDREVLLNLFPEAKAKISGAENTTDSVKSQGQTVSDQVAVVESWHLPSGKDAGDGLHLITCDGEELWSEEWKRDYFPFAKLPWAPRMFGFWSQGLAEQIQPIQTEINKLLFVIQRSYQLAGSFKIWLQTGGKVVKEQLNNEVGTLIQSEVKPEYMVPPIVPPEMYAWFKSLKDNAFEQAGVSMLSAASQKPAGLDSGKALREYNNIESDRFMIAGQNYENFFLDLARMTIDLAKEIYQREGKYEVKVPGKKFIETIDWKDIDLDEDDFFMKSYPVSSLPNDPSGRLQTIQEYVQAGFMSPEVARRLLDFPDLEQEEERANSPIDWINKSLEKMVDDGEYTPPEPQDRLDLAGKMALEYYAQGKVSNLEPERLELIRTYIDQVSALVQKSMPPPPPQVPGGASAPQAAPMPPPQSDMIPNQPGEAA